MNHSSARSRLGIWIAPVAVLMVVAGVWQQVDLHRLKAEHTSLLERARDRGINPDAPTSLPTKPYPRRDPKEEVRMLAEALVHRSRNGETDQTDWVAQMELSEQFEGLNPAQLREMIGIFLKDKEVHERMPGRLCVLLTVDLLQRLARDFPEEALEHMKVVDTWFPEGTARHYFMDGLSKIATCFGEKSPDVAWKWYLDTQKGKIEGFDPIREAVLGGIARRDPGLALRYAQEAGGEEAGIYFLGFYCTTLDQRVAAVKALRAWCSDDERKKVKLDAFIKEQTLKSGYGEKLRFEGVTSWIEQAGLASEEISFLGDRSKVDLAGYVDPRDTGKLIEWLDRTFPEKQANQQIKHLVEDNRTAASAKAWLATLPAEQVAAIEKRLVEE